MALASLPSRGTPGRRAARRRCDPHDGTGRAPSAGPALGGRHPAGRGAGRAVRALARSARGGRDRDREERGITGLLLDQALLDLQRMIGQKLALHHSDAGDESALSLTRQQRELIDGNRDTLLFDEARREAGGRQPRRIGDGSAVSKAAGCRCGSRGSAALSVASLSSVMRARRRTGDSPCSSNCRRSWLTTEPIWTAWSLAGEQDYDWGQIPSCSTVRVR